MANRSDQDIIFFGDERSILTEPDLTGKNCKKPGFLKKPGFYLFDRPQANLQLLQGRSAT
ncbi:MAG: hypothetical protein P2A85_09305 [Microcoleus anatoxicus]|uniref:hypothetical protein n=1 Tax=Microcoleus anatoxicus TaxID=2705319 RepID=UPI00366F029D